jgi:outer membrane protein OmpA-like peptidoglycan-associated protein
MKRIVLVLTLCAFLVAGAGCTSTQKGAVIGSGTGAAVGAMIGKATGSNTAVAAIVGAAVGGTAGALIGRQMDKQAAEMEQDLEGVRVERVGEGIKLTFDSGILFDVNKADLQTEAKMNLEKLATILNKYPDTDIIIEGHTDSTGSEEWNLELSRMRAQSVGSYLATLSVDPGRFTQVGYGEMQPVATNETMDGRKQNRRVELAIMANERMKKAAEKQAAG